MSDKGSNGGSVAPPYMLVRCRDNQRFAIHFGRNTIGRSADCDIVVESNAASREHCVLLVDERGGCELRDNHSRNGTYVTLTSGPESQRADRVRLSHGDRINVCDQWFVLESPLPVDCNLLGSEPNFPFRALGREFLAELGRGTTGVVYKVMDVRLGRITAVKTVLPYAAEERAAQSARFRREAQILASFNHARHPSIVPVFEVGECEGQAYLSREFVDGNTLEELVTAGSINLRERIHLLATVAKTVAEVHDRGFVHRNLRPANILVGHGNIAKLIGFGLVGVRAGSPRLPPGKSGDSAERDTWALCGMLDWLCTELQEPLSSQLEAVRREYRDAGSVCPFGSAADLAEALFAALD